MINNRSFVFLFSCFIIFFFEKKIMVVVSKKCVTLEWRKEKGGKDVYV